MQKIVVITAGGGVATRRGPGAGAAVPTIKGDDLASQLPRDIDLAFVEFSNVPGSHFTPAQGLELARRVEAALQPDEVGGVVVAHGADTLEETAYLLDLVVAAEKPVVVTGAVRPPTAPGYDGLTNLASAIRVAAAPEARTLGVLVVFAERIFAAAAVQSVHSQALQAFDAPGAGPLGRVEAGRVWIGQRPAQRQHIPCTRLEERVDLIAIGQGSDDRLLRRAVEDGAAGVVLEAFGGGRVPPWWLPTIREAIAQRTAVAVAPRCGAGPLYDEYGYVGAYHDLQQLGALFAHHLSGPKARIKLMVALGAARRIEDVRAWFAA
ncbi:MAG TPA: asparaginase [Roseiflexaceae bacterium]|nr:asparaginase [Roseiflexaceae bacterium]